jgi:hypothetical protein
VKCSKCAFGDHEVEYLGHIVSQKSVRVDPKKVVAIQYWPRPKTLKRLRGLLGIIGYYMKFVKNCGKMVASLTSLLKKKAFVWSKVETHAFIALKDAMCTTPILTVPEFNKTFVLECDYLGRGLETILMQEGCPLEFTSEKLCDRNLGKPTYEKEMMVILHTMETWCPYIIGMHFQIKTDHHSLKYLIEQ